MSDLQSQMDRANQLALIKSRDTSLTDLITGVQAVPHNGTHVLGHAVQLLCSCGEMPVSWFDKGMPCPPPPNKAARSTCMALPPVAAGRAEIASGQAALSAQLDVLLQRQQAAVDSMAKAEAQVMM